MKVVAFNGSARAKGNTAILLNSALDELKSGGIETELISLAGQTLPGCRACYRCFETKDGHCVVDGDAINGYIDKMREADGIILGSPVYFSDVSAGMKALMERSGMTSRANNHLFRRKVGAGVVAVRRGGAIHTFDTLNHFFLIGQMVVVGSIYWNLGIGREPGEVEKDAEGLETMKVLGSHMAWLLKKIHG